MMLDWLRERLTFRHFPVIIDHAISERIAVNPHRTATIFTNLSSSKTLRLRTLFEQDGYEALGVSVHHLKNCFIDINSGLVVRQDGMLDETCRLVASYYVDTTREGVANGVRKAASSTIEDDLIHVFHRSCSAYGHFILDGLCAVAVLGDLIRAHHLKILVPAILPAWVSDILASIGFGPDRIKQVAGKVRCRSLTTSTMLTGSNCFLPNPDTISRLRTLVDAPAAKASRHIYLTRDGAYSPRFVDNEADVQAIFQQVGFDIVSPASLSFRQQVELFASAKVIAGNHGSALTNIVFTPPGAKIIDLMPEDWVGYWGDSGTPERWLLNLTAACGHDYALVVSSSKMTGQPYLPNTSTELARIDTTIDLEMVRQALA